MDFVDLLGCLFDSLMWIYASFVWLIAYGLFALV